MFLWNIGLSKHRFWWVFKISWNSCRIRVFSWCMSHYFCLRCDLVQTPCLQPTLYILWTWYRLSASFKTPVSRATCPGGIPAHKTSGVSLYWFSRKCWISAVPLNGTAGSCAWCHVVHGIMWQCSVRSPRWAGCHNGKDHVAAHGMSSLCDTVHGPQRHSFTQTICCIS